MTRKAQQSALDNTLVASKNQHVVGKCNMRINPGMKPKEPTYQVVLDALALTTCYLAFLIITEVLVIYMHQFWATVNKHNASYRFKIDKKREIKYITDIDHLHQPWRTFASINNKCLCGKVSGLDKIRLSRVYILWGMYYKKNLDFVALIWEDLAYQIDNKDFKKQDKMFYPRFTKIIIHHFLKKDKSILMRNRTFMHTARDDSLLGTMRFVSRHEDTQVYGALLPKAMTNQAMLDSVAYKTYYVIASGAELPKSKKTKTKSDSAISSEETSSQKKPNKAKKDVPSTKKPATKPKPTKKKVSVKADRGKSLNIHSEVALSEAAQLKEVTKQSKKDFHISYASGSGDSGEEEDDDQDDTEDDEANDDGDDNDEHKEEEENVDEFTNKEDDNENEEELDDEKLLNFENVSPADNEIASLMDITVHNEEPIVSDFATLVIERNVIESLEATVLAKSSTQPKSTYEAAASLSNYELTKILLDKMDESKSHLRDDYKMKLYDALVESYNKDKDLFNTYGKVFTLKRSRVKMINIKIKTPSLDQTDGRKEESLAGKLSNQRSKRGQVIQLMTLECKKNQESDTSNNDEQLDDEATSKNDWISVTARAKKPPTSFDELIDTPIDFFAFFINRLNITKSDSRTSDHQGRQVIPQDYFINNKLEYLKGGSLSRQYSTFVTKTKAATYEIQWIEDMVPNLRSLVNVVYNKHAYWDIDKKLFQRRLIQNLEKFVDGREYENDLRKIVTYRFTLTVLSALRRSGNPDDRSYWIKTSQDSMPHAHT
nr:hypothetical protein [Tanacetum cinerariifolium]